MNIFGLNLLRKKERYVILQKLYKEKGARVISNVVKVFRKIPYYFVVGALLEGFWLVYAQLKYSYSRSMLNNGYHVIDAVNNMFSIFALFFMSAVLLVSYVRSFVLGKQNDFMKIFGVVLGFLTLVFADIYYAEYLGSNLDSMIYNILICTVIYIFGIFLFVYLCSDDILMNVFNKYRKEILVFLAITIGYIALFGGTLYDIIARVKGVLIANFSFSFDGSEFRFIVAISIMYLVYKLKFDGNNYINREEAKAHDAVGIFAIYFALGIFSNILSTYIRAVPKILNRILNGSIITWRDIDWNICPSVLTIIAILMSAFILILFLKRKFTNYKKVIISLAILVVVNLMEVFQQLIFASFIYNSGYRFEFFSLLNSFFITAVPTILILIFFIRSKRIKLYFNPKQKSIDL